MSQRARLARHTGKLMIHWMALTHRNGNVSSVLEDIKKSIVSVCFHDN